MTATIRRVPACTSARWTEDIPHPADSPEAVARLDRELTRPLAPGHPARQILLRYTCGTADLITIHPRPNAPTEAPDPPLWGLGDPATPHTQSTHLTVPFPTGHVGDGAAGARGSEFVVGAVGLVLARYVGEDVVSVGGVEPGRGVRLTVAGTVEEYLGGVRDAGDGVPLVGVAVTGAGERPFLEAVHPLSLHVDAETAVLRCWYRPRYFDGEVVAQFVRMVGTAYGALRDADQATPVADVELFDEEERRRLAELGGCGLTVTPPDQCIHEAIAEQAARRPDAIAVCCGDERITYGELWRRAQRVAAGLRGRGVGPGTLVGVCLDRSVDLIVAMLGVLASGAAYVPMDPRYPAERRAFTADDAKCRLVMGAIPLSTVDGEPEVPQGTPDDPAYVIYTSGSTGTPKGVVVKHRSVLSLLAATRQDFGLDENDVWTMFHSAAFDFSVWEAWGCLMTGGRLVVVPYEVSRAPEEFAALLTRERVTVLSQTPSAFGQVRELDLPDSLRLVVFGGEPLDVAPLTSWFDRHPERTCRLVNMFGITETTVHVTAQTVTRREALTASRSVGRPLPGWHVAILDPAGRPVPPGVAGEIHVGGAGVAAGYLNRPELTAERFRNGWYRSGDRGRLLPDGRIEHLGRLDDQVQLRGFRIEPAEARAAVLSAPGVVAAAVVLRQPGDAATAHLAAYVVFGDAGGDPDDVLAHARRVLPEHMVPSSITPLPVLPLTANGKVDVARLPEPTRAAAPANTGLVSDRVLSAWESVFGFRIGPDDDFFALGGNSLLAVRLSVALRTAGLPGFTVRQLYRHRTAGALTAALETS